MPFTHLPWSWYPYLPWVLSTITRDLLLQTNKTQKWITWIITQLWRIGFITLRYLYETTWKLILGPDWTMVEPPAKPKSTGLLKYVPPMTPLTKAFNSIKELYSTKRRCKIRACTSRSIYRCNNCHLVYCDSHSTRICQFCFETWKLGIKLDKSENTCTSQLNCTFFVK